MPRFITKKWIKVQDQSSNEENRYKPGQQIRFRTPMLRSDLLDYSDACIVVEETRTDLGGHIDEYDRTLAFKNNSPFISCISKINNTVTDNVEDLDVVMPVYNLLEYSKNYRRTSGSLWNYY